MYKIKIVPSAIKELNKAPVFYRRQIEEAIEKQLPHTPDLRTRNRKCLPSAVPGFEYEEPIWELRVGDWRVFYDIGLEEQIVTIRAIRCKEQGQLTEDIL